MKAKTFSKPNRSRDRKGRGLSPERKRRGPVFTLTREQVFEKCRAKKHRLICAGEVLALMDLMEMRGWHSCPVSFRRARNGPGTSRIPHRSSSMAFGLGLHEDNDSSPLRARLLTA